MLLALDFSRCATNGHHCESTSQLQFGSLCAHRTRLVQFQWYNSFPQPGTRFNSNVSINYRNAMSSRFVIDFDSTREQFILCCRIWRPHSSSGLVESFMYMVSGDNRGAKKDLKSREWMGSQGFQRLVVLCFAGETCLDSRDRPQVATGLEMPLRKHQVAHLHHPPSPTRRAWRRFPSIASSPCWLASFYTAKGRVVCYR
jgi:hypothetical protein